MMNLPRTNQLDLIIQDPETTKITHKRLSKRKFKAALKDTSNVLEKMHTSVREKTERRRKSNKKSKEKHSTIGSFATGCYILYAQVIKKVNSKIHIRWKGPYRVIKCLWTQVYRIQHLIDTDIVLEAHAIRMKYYGHPSMEITEILIDNVNHQDSLRFSIKNIHEHRYDEHSKAYEFLVQWKGFSILENSWEPFETLFQDAPLVLKKYARTLPKTSDNDVLTDYLTHISSR